jgi:hypothetical protein
MMFSRWYRLGVLCRLVAALVCAVPAMPFVIIGMGLQYGGKAVYACRVPFLKIAEFVGG